MIQSSKHGGMNHDIMCSLQKVFKVHGVVHLKQDFYMGTYCTSSVVVWMHLDDPCLSEAASSSSSRALCGLQILALTKVYFSSSSHQGAHGLIGGSGCSLVVSVGNTVYY